MQRAQNETNALRTELLERRQELEEAKLSLVRTQCERASPSTLAHAPYCASLAPCPEQGPDRNPAHKEGNCGVP